METKNIVFFELISKKSKSFFKSLVFNKSEMYEYSFSEICFFMLLILNLLSFENYVIDEQVDILYHYDVFENLRF